MRPYRFILNFGYAMKKFLIYFLLCFATINLISDSKIVIDSKMKLKESMKNTLATKKIAKEQVLIDVEYYGFDDKLHKGQLVVSKNVQKDITDAFELIKKIKFPIEKVIPIVKYDWDDNKSMSDNNTSAFNYRTIAGTDRLSNHSFGKAIDINPFQNPAIYNDGRVAPEGAKYDISAKGTLTAESVITKFFKERGWRWGGDWTKLKDYQHFDKPE